MRNATETDRHMAEQDDRDRPDTGPDREEVRGVGDAGDDFEEEDDDLIDEDDDEDEGTF
jgi:hypothetical protein